MKFNKLFRLLPVEQKSWLPLFSHSISYHLLTQLQVDIKRENIEAKLQRSKQFLGESMVDKPEVIEQIPREITVVDSLYNNFKVTLPDGIKVINITSSTKDFRISNVILGFDKDVEMVNLYIISRGNLCRVKTYITNDEATRILLSTDAPSFVAKYYSEALEVLCNCNKYKNNQATTASIEHTNIN